MHPFDLRLAWCRAAMTIWGPWVEVTTLERDLAQAQPGPSYTLRLLDAVALAHPDVAGERMERDTADAVGAGQLPGGVDDRCHLRLSSFCHCPYH